VIAVLTTSVTASIRAKGKIPRTKQSTGGQQQHIQPTSGRQKQQWQQSTGGDKNEDGKLVVP